MSKRLVLCTVYFGVLMYLHEVWRKLRSVSGTDDGPNIIAISSSNTMNADQAVQNSSKQRPVLLKSSGFYTYIQS